MRQPAISTSYSRLSQNEHPTNTDDTCLESETPDNCEVKPLSHSFIDVMQIGTLFYGKYEITASEISQCTGHAEIQVAALLSKWYQRVCISAGIGRVLLDVRERSRKVRVRDYSTAQSTVGKYVWTHNNFRTYTRESSKKGFGSIPYKDRHLSLKRRAGYRRISEQDHDRFFGRLSPAR